ncbi:MAG: biopolymer transporter ExbD [Imperialibacter sp.]|uniref:ExbD/TolR family protein n=1 Tax=Imperialibacter sp. TaxID=2038411 RepID=UPI0032ECEC9F
MPEINQSPPSGGKDNKVKAKKMSTKIDMTPMVDLAFLLLTFFMLATTFNKPQTMEITMPEKPKDESEQPLVNEKRVLNLLLANNDKIYWYVGLTDPTPATTNYTPEGVRAVLVEQSNAISGLVVLIKPTEQSTYQNLVDILDEMQITNMTRYALVEPEVAETMLIEKINPSPL